MNNVCIGACHVREFKCEHATNTTNSVINWNNHAPGILSHMVTPDDLTVV